MAVFRGGCVGGIMAARKIRSDSTVKAAEKRLGIKNAIRNADGSNARSDKKIGTLRKEAAKKERSRRMPCEISSK
jgi:hypothetical protein